MLPLLSILSFADPLSADAVVAYALESHPDAVRARMAIATADGNHRESALFATSPTVTFEVTHAPHELTIDQPIGFYGASAHRADRLTSTAATSESERQDLVVAADARLAYARAITARDRRELADAGLDQARKMRSAVEIRANSGEAPPLDVNLVRLSEAEAAALAATARRDEADADVVLAGLLPADLVLELLDDPRAVLPTPRGPSSRADVQAAAARVDAADAALSRERARNVPQISLGIGVFDLETSPEFGGRFALTPPVWSQNQGGIAAAAEALAVARAELDRLEIRAATERRRFTETADATDAILASLGDFETEARSALTSIELGWSTGELRLAEAVILRRQALSGWDSAVETRQIAVESRLASLLADQDPSLLGAE